MKININSRISLIKLRTKKGFSLVEVLVGTAVFVLLAISVCQAYLLTMNVIQTSRIKVTATALANEQFEIMRNLPYTDVGIPNSSPAGKIPHTQNLVRDGKEFLITTTIRNIDDPFDGTVKGEPKDLSPADYKLAELKITCLNCKDSATINMTTHIAPKNLETASVNGALFIQVIDAVGQPIPEANVYIRNNEKIPNFIIDDTTNNDGLLQIVDAPPGAEAYEISVSKSGYTSDQTYDPTKITNPSKAHATVLTQQLTEISFVIDKVSTLSVVSTNETCDPIPNIDFTLQGEKLIGTEPDVYKFPETGYSTDGSGLAVIDDLEWDTYNLTATNSSYNLAGVIPASIFTITPNSSQNLKLVMSQIIPKSLLVTVKDSSTNLPLSDANVQLVGTEYDNTLVTGQGYYRQTNWSLGANQEDFIDQAKYYDSDNNLEISDPVGEIHLLKTLDEYASSAWLISSTFDTGSASNFHQILWQPQSQPPEAGSNSVRFQIATNNDKENWDFKGPDGTSNTYYSLSEQEINSLHNGDRYFRYKIFLQTADTTKTPTVSDISFTYTSNCLPPGQVFFTGLTQNSYTINITKAGFEPYTNTVSTTNDWQQHNVDLTPSEAL